MSAGGCALVAFPRSRDDIVACVRVAADHGLPVVPRGGADAEPLDADAVREFATGKLAHYKVPRYVIVVDDFPMTVTGKVRKVEMREKSTAELGLA